MDIGEAMQCLRNGHPVTRAVWEAHAAVTDYVRLEMEQIAWNSVIIFSVCEDGSRWAYTCSHGDLLADDWKRAE